MHPHLRLVRACVRIGRQLGRRVGRPSRAALAAALLTSVATLGACGRVADLVAPGEKGFAPARLALSATLPALQQQGTASLRVSATYERTDGAQVPLGTQTIALTEARTQDVPVSIELGACLNDPQRRAGAGASACTVRLTLALLLDGRVLDEQAAGPFVLQPGVTVGAPAAVTLHQVRTVRIDLPTGAVTRPDGSVRLEVGAALALGATALDPSGATVSGRTAEWITSAPTVATVGASTGLVTGVAPGSARITASIGGRATTLDVVVVPRAALLTITGGGTGSGTVRSTPAGIECRIVNGQPQGACTFTFPGDAQVSLLAVTDAGSGFAGWGEACATTGTTTTCVVATDQPRTVRASFGTLRTLSVGGAGDGAGTITSSPAGIACTLGADASGRCSAPFLDGTTVTLSAAPATGSTFVDWSGDCAGATGSTCTVTVSATLRAVTARFARPQGLDVTVGGTGEGSVAATVGASTLSCVRRTGATTGTCSATAPFNTVVTLTATPEANSTFAGWTGACSGTGPCTVTIDRARSVGATFTRRQVALTVVVGGAGAGAITANGDRCELAAGQGSQSCTLRVDVASPVTLTAVPATGSEFGTWSGACASSGRSPTCTITPTADASVGATFVPGAVRITIVGEANTTGVGSVSSGDGRLACTVRGATTTGTCEALVPVGTTLTLDASHDPNSTFGSWSGACAGTAGTRCTLVVRTAASVGARFLRQQTPLTIGVSGSGAGTVSLNGAPVCTLAANQGSTSCARAVDAGASVTLTLQPAAGSVASWGGPCANVPVTGPCTFVPAITGASVPVSFALPAPVLPTVSVRPVAGYRGGGRVQSSDERIDCTIAPGTGALSGTCDATYPAGTAVTLALTSFSMSEFTGGWSGLCTSTSATCAFTVPSTGGVARITLPEVTGVSLTATGAGVITVQVPGQPSLPPYSVNAHTSPAPPSIYPAFEGKTVTLTAAGDAANGFRQWSGACAAAGTSPVCTLVLPAGMTLATVNAAFDFAVPVSVGGDAGGTVTVQGITGPTTVCTRPTGGTTNCVLRAPSVTTTLVASPVTGSEFIGWQGAASQCGSSTTCVVRLDSLAGSAQAEFGPVALPIDIRSNPASTGHGVVETPFGSCVLTASEHTGDCDLDAFAGGTVSFTATPATGSVFAGWTGLCAGQPDPICTLSPVTTGGTITARFDVAPPVTLTVQGSSGSGDSGAGFVTSVSPTGISCSISGASTSDNCSASFPVGTSVTLSATPLSNSGFLGWTGACSGSSPTCVVTMTQARTVGARFAPTF
jgi:hypothetical protein